MKFSPKVLDLPSYPDDRGALTPVFNGEYRQSDRTCSIAGVTLTDVSRAYFINNSQKGVIRGFHYHEHETKYFVILRGMAKFVAGNPEDVADLHVHVLTERKPQMLIIPPGYANGWMSLTDDCLLLALSSSTFEESKHDDKRYPVDYFGDVWKVKGR